MITISTKKSIRKPADSFVILSRMDYELVCRVLQLLGETGLDDEEFSFLIGKRNQYFFDIIDPRKKQKLKTGQVDPLAAIFGKPHRKIIPRFIKPGEIIHIHHATRRVEEDEENKTITYSHIIYPRESTEGIKIIWEKKFAKGVRHKLNNTVLEFLEQKIESGYFRKPCLTLPLYLEMKKKLGTGTFTVMDLERALAKLMRGHGPLMYTSIDTQNHYFERHEIVFGHDSDADRLVEIWEASVRATHHFLSEEDIQFFLPMVRDELLPQLELYCIRNRSEKIMGFMGLTGNKVEALFIHPEYIGRGLGAFLITKAIKLKGKPLLVEVNEQNPKAVRFYERLGFKVVSRSELDASGRPFPILHMELGERVEEG